MGSTQVDQSAVNADLSRVGLIIERRDSPGGKSASLRVGAAADRRKHAREVMGTAIVPTQDEGMEDFEAVWTRVVASAGLEFRTKTGLPFRYLVDGPWVFPDRTVHRLSKRDFATAWALMPLHGPGDINREVHGPSYIYAILSDARVAGNSR